MSVIILHNKLKATFILNTRPNLDRITLSFFLFCSFSHSAGGKNLPCFPSLSVTNLQIQIDRSARSSAAVQISLAVQPLSMSVGSVRLSPNERVDSSD